MYPVCATEFDGVKQAIGVSKYGHIPNIEKAQVFLSTDPWIPKLNFWMSNFITQSQEYLNVFVVITCAYTDYKTLISDRWEFVCLGR